MEVNFAGPFKYDIDSYVENVRKTIQNEIHDRRVMIRMSSPPRRESPSKKKSSPASTPLDLSSQANNNVSASASGTATPTAIESTLTKLTGSKSKGKDKATVDPMDTILKKQVKDVDGALAGTILQYMRHHGHFDSASAFTKEVTKRNQNGIIEKSDSSALSTKSSSASIELSKNRAREGDGFAKNLHDVRTTYARHETKRCWELLHKHFPRELLANERIWACRLRLQWFITLLCADEEAFDLAIFRKELHSTETETFYEFLSGVSPSSAESAFESRNDWLIVVGRHLQRNLPVEKPNDELVAVMNKAFACMAYAEREQWPKDLMMGLGNTDYDEAGAEELVADIRRECDRVELRNLC